MRIQVKPLEIDKWHGKKGQESFTRAKTIQALVDPYTYTYATGLNNEDRTFKDPDNIKNLITEEQLYSKLLKVDLSKQFDIDNPHPFWDSKMGEIKLENRTMFFNTDNPVDYIKVKVMKESKYIANSLQDYETGLFPEATHVIFDEAEEVQVKATTVETKNRVIIESSKLTLGQKIDLITILSAGSDYLRTKALRGKSDAFVSVELDKYIQKNPKEVLRVMSLSKEDLGTQALVLEALQRHVLVKEGLRIKYFEEHLGNDINEVVDRLNMPDYNDIKIRIMQQLNA